MNYSIQTETSMKIEASRLLTETRQSLLGIATSTPVEPFTGCAVIYPEDLKNFYYDAEDTDWASKKHKDEILEFVRALNAMKEEPARILLLF